MAEGKPKPNWFTLSAVAGALAGFLFVVLFVRVPGAGGVDETGPGDGLLGLFLLLFTFGGGYLGLQFYKWRGCSLGLHTWQRYELPAEKRCLNCKRIEHPASARHPQPHSTSSDLQPSPRSRA